MKEFENISFMSNVQSSLTKLGCNDGKDMVVGTVDMLEQWNKLTMM